VAAATRDVYNIPYRSLYSRNISNLFLAGRNISCSHVAFTPVEAEALRITVHATNGGGAARIFEVRCYGS